MSTKYAIAVDGGGTKTAVALAPISSFDGHRFPERKIRTISVNLPSNVSTVGPDGFAEVLRECTRAAQLRLKDVGFAFFGLAGVDHPRVADAVADQIRRAGVDRRVPLEVHNDLLVGLRAVYRPHEVAGALIAGTGSNCAVELSDGSLHKVGGTGWLLGDTLRAGSSIGRRAMQWFVEELQMKGDIDRLPVRELSARVRRNKDHLMTLIARRIQLLVSEEGESGKAPSSQTFMHWLYSHVYLSEGRHRVPDATRVRLLGQFARDVVEAARRKHAEAWEMLSNVGREIGSYLLKTIQSSPEAPDRVALVGGVVANPGIVRDHVERAVQKLGQRLKLCPFPDGEKLIESALQGAHARHVADDAA